jgi:type II secretory pathway component GspD/PulD (secretin)
MAASGGSLLKRVRRLLGQPPVSTGSGAWVMGVVIALAAALWLAEGRNATARAMPFDQAGAVGSTSSGETPAGSTNLYTRVYRLDPASFLSEIRKAMANPDGTLPGLSDSQSAVRKFIQQAGVTFSTNSTSIAADASPESESNGRALLFNDQTGVLLVRAALEELDVIDQALQVVHSVPHQVEIEIKFVELEDDDLRTLGLQSILQTRAPEAQLLVTNRTGALVLPDGATNVNLFAPATLRGVEKVTEGMLGILADAQFRTVLRAINQQAEAKVLAAPRVTTLSGRQARIEIAEIRNIVTGVTLGERNTFNTTPIHVGPSIDVIPHVTADGRQIQMTLIPGLTAFVGYDDPGPFMSSTGGVLVPRPIPRFHVSQTIVSATVPIGQTLVLGGFEGEAPPSDKATFARPKQVVIFVTPFLVDPAGNRLNPD